MPPWAPLCCLCLCALALQTYKWATFQQRTAAKVELILAEQQEQGPSPEEDSAQAAASGEAPAPGVDRARSRRRGGLGRAGAGTWRMRTPGAVARGGETEATPERILGQNLELWRIGIDFSKLKSRNAKVKTLDEASGRHVTRRVVAVDPRSIPPRNAYDHGWGANLWEVLSPRSKREYSLSPSLERKRR